MASKESASGSTEETRPKVTRLDDNGDELSAFNSFQFWRTPLPALDLSLLDSPSTLMLDKDSSVRDTTEEMETCCCGRLIGEHLELDSSSWLPPSGEEEAWCVVQHTKTSPTDAFGSIDFQRSNKCSCRAKYVRLSCDAKPEEIRHLMLREWNMAQPKLLISVHGGTDNFSLPPRVGQAFSKGLIRAAETAGAWIFTDGFNTGVSMYVGDAVKLYGTHERRKRTVIGITPWGLIENHTDLIGRDRVPLVCVVVEGGPAVLSIVLDYVSRSPPVPVIVFEGTGRAADLLSLIHKQTAADRELDVNIKEDFLKRIENLFGVARMKAHQLFTVLKHCMDHRDVITIFDSESEDHLEADVAILTASLRGAPAEKLNITLAWDRADIAQQHVLVYGHHWKVEALEHAMLNALLMDRVSFVKLLIENGVTMKHFLTVSRLEELYNMQKQGSSDHFLRHIIEDAKKCRLPGKYKISLIDIGMVIEYLIGGAYRSTYRKKRFKAVYNRIHTELKEVSEERSASRRPCTEQPKTNQPQPQFHRTADPYKRKMKSESEADEVEAVEKEPGKTSPFVYSFNDLFVWAVLKRRQQMALFLWQHGMQAMARAVVACRLYQAMASEAKESSMHYSIADELRKYSLEFGQLAVDLLDKAFKENERMAMKLLTWEMTDWSNFTCLQMAVASGHRPLVTHSCTQMLLTDLWMGRLNMRKNSWLKIIVSILLPVGIQLLEFKSEAEMSHVPQSHEALHFGRDAGSLGEPEDVMQADESDAERGQRHVKHRGNPVAWWLPWCRKVYDFYSAPVVKFWVHTMFYLTFLALFSFTVLVRMEPSPSVPEWLVISYISSTAIDKIRELKNMLYILVIMGIVLMSYGTPRWSILNPHEEPSWDLLKQVLFQPYFMMFGEVYAGEINRGAEEMMGTLAEVSEKVQFIQESLQTLDAHLGQLQDLSALAVDTLNLLSASENRQQEAVHLCPSPRITVMSCSQSPVPGNVTPSHIPPSPKANFSNPPSLWRGIVHGKSCSSLELSQGSSGSCFDSKLKWVLGNLEVEHSNPRQRLGGDSSVGFRLSHGSLSNLLPDLHGSPGQSCASSLTTVWDQEPQQVPSQEESMEEDDYDDDVFIDTKSKKNSVLGIVNPAFCDDNELDIPRQSHFGRKQPITTERKLGHSRSLSSSVETLAIPKKRHSVSGEPIPLHPGQKDRGLYRILERKRSFGRKCVKIKEGEATDRRLERDLSRRSKRKGKGMAGRKFRSSVSLSQLNFDHVDFLQKSGILGQNTRSPSQSVWSSWARSVSRRSSVQSWAAVERRPSVFKSTEDLDPHYSAMERNNLMRLAHTIPFTPVSLLGGEEVYIYNLEESEPDSMLSSASSWCQRGRAAVLQPVTEQGVLDGGLRRAQWVLCTWAEEDVLRPGCVYVVKSFREEVVDTRQAEFPTNTTLHLCLRDIQQQRAAQKLMQVFNQVKPSSMPHSPKFLDVCLLWWQAKGQWLTIERSMNGDFRKYNNNTGEEIMPSCGLEETVLAFSHWTYEYTGRELLVLDLQGVGLELTEPSVIRAVDKSSSRDLVFGSTSWDDDPVQNFVLKHTCNLCCEKLGLTAIYNSEETIQELD
ncbi:transient receptor potential cation channel subfamily M member 6-like isoform X1 [Clarias magur]|uniref:non-specific serine/threonine protein kinase n=1 Tax=Clarias magur TaxID=1594786 RepID=A0A8J4U3F7_CLAMG|nr:transient receptor potential cation channel subfamily M member 6-like isoform X1 [Clarias magur]